MAGNLQGDEREKAHAKTLELPLDKVEGMLAEEAEKERLAVLRKSIVDNPAPEELDIAAFGEVFAKGEEASGNGTRIVQSVSATDPVSTVSPNGGEPTQAVVTETNEGQAAAETAKSGNGKAAEPTTDTTVSMQERAVAETIAARHQRDARAAARSAAGSGGDASAKKAGSNPPQGGGDPQRANNPGEGGNNPPPPPDNPRRGNPGGDEPPEGEKQMREKIAGWALAVAALLFLVFWWPGPRIAHWWSAPAIEPVATAPTNLSGQESDEERRLNEGLNAQVAGLEKENANLRKELRDIADDRAKALTAFIEKAKAAVDARSTLAAAPCDCPKVAAAPRKAPARVVRAPRRPPPVDTRPPVREQQPAQQPATASTTPVGPVTASTDTLPQQFYVEVRKGSREGPLIGESLHFNIRYLDSGRRLFQRFGLDVQGGRSRTVEFPITPGTSFQVVGPPNLDYVQPSPGSMLEAKASEADPTRVARILFVVR